MSVLSRRTLLTSVSSVLFPRVTGSNLPASAAGQTVALGRINLGLQGITHYSLVYPFLNVWKCAAAVQVIAGDISFLSTATPGTPFSAWGRFLDSNGELIDPVPTNVTRLTRIFYAPPINGLPDGYNRAGERWVLKWDGTARNIAIDGATSIARTGNRIEWVWTSNTRNMWVSFFDPMRDDPPRNIRLCETRLEDRLDAGEVFNPEWLSNVRKPRVLCVS